MISYDLWPSQLLGNYQLTTTTSTKYRTKLLLLREYTIYYHVSSRPWIVKYTTVPYPSVYSDKEERGLHPSRSVTMYRHACETQKTKHRRIADRHVA
jgi:hypothetical protein